MIPITVLSGWKLNCDWLIPLLKPDVGDVLYLGVSRRESNFWKFTPPVSIKDQGRHLRQVSEENILTINFMSPFLLQIQHTLSVMCIALAHHSTAPGYCPHDWFNFSLATLPNSWVVCSFWLLPIDDLHISHNGSGMGANIRVLLIRNSSSHSSLNVNGLELPCLAATLCF